MDTSSVLGYRDFPYSGPQTTATSTITVEQVVRNVTKMILFSKKGDYGRNITKGGVVIDTIGKSLNQVTSESIKRSIEEAISELSSIQPTSVDVQFSTSERAWKIHVVFVDTLNKFVSSVDLVVEG